MSISSVGSSHLQSVANVLLQQLQSGGGSSQGASDLSSTLGDRVTLSPAAQQLAQVPVALSQAMTDLLSGHKVAQGDLARLQSYLQKDPQGLANLLSSVQAGSGRDSASSALGSRDALVTALMNHQSSGSNPAALLSLLKGAQTQDPLLASLGSTGSGSDGSLSPLFG